MSEYHWTSEDGTPYYVHEGSGIVFVVFEDGHGQSVASSGVGREILRLRDAAEAERERCAKVCEAAAERVLPHQRPITSMALRDAAHEIRHPTAPASDTDPEPAER